MPSTCLGRYDIPSSGTLLYVILSILDDKHHYRRGPKTPLNKLPCLTIQTMNITRNYVQRYYISGENNLPAVDPLGASDGQTRRENYA